jgi:hypothetical protein
MQIIWNKEAAQRLQSNQTVLELETFQVEDKTITAYCVVPAEKIFPEITQLDQIKTLHQEFISAYNNKNYQLCKDLAPELVGKLGGELDSFYQEIINKINASSNTN